MSTTAEKIPAFEKPPSAEGPLKVALLGLGERDRAMMELFLHRYCSGDCRLVSEEDAGLCILDLDGIEGRTLLQTERDHHPQRPLIALSLHKQDIDGALVLRKPLGTGVLKTAIDFYRSKAASAALVSDTAARLVSSPADAEQAAAIGEAPVGFSGRDPRGALHSLECQTVVIQECFGAAGAFDLSTGRGSDKLYYDSGNLLQHHLSEAIGRSRREGRPVNLHLPDGKAVVLLPRAQIALTDLSDARLRPRTLMEMQPEQIRIEGFDSSETLLLHEQSHQAQRVEALLWKVSLWSARGRLPQGTEINAPVGLQRWPNLTRLLWFPQFMRIAALWARAPLSLVETVAALDIEARYVCGFFSACHALGLAQIQVQESSAEAASFRPIEPSHSSLLRRILHHLRIG